MEPILKTVAREYAGRYSDLKNICFIFPNKRCGVFLKKYFSEFEVFTEELPHILTISEFMCQTSKTIEAGKIELLFTLFNAYKQILNQDDNQDSETVSFDSFRSWGETVLSDFNIVDMNLTDPHEIFKNVKDYREIASNFLTEEQKEVMREYFGVHDFEGSTDFWKNFSDTEILSSSKRDFINLWQILSPLHDIFVSSLKEKGLGFPGSIYRGAYERIEEKGRDALPYKKIVAVGFNALTASERGIFHILQDQKGYPGYDDFIDFIWDATGPILKSENFNASRFVDYNKTQFPEPDWLKPVFDLIEIRDYPEIEIIAAPSNSAQTKVAGEIIRNKIKDYGEKIIKESEVALILPDESLLSNMLFALPDDTTDINLTMGMSFRFTPISSFMSVLKRLYASMRESKKGKYFYSRDLKLFFTHPYAYLIFQESQIISLIKYIEENHKISVTPEEIGDFISEATELLAFPSKTSEGYEIFDFLYKIFASLKKNIVEEDEEPGENQDFLQVKIYEEYIKSLEETVKYYEIPASSLSLLQMADRLVASEKIGFEGEPLRGLQVMGTLETRSLDFKHIIILSMNEGIMPRKSMISTFIPESLRRAYGLPPSKYSEEIFGYYFYRLISRAEKVTLIYDGRTVSGMRGGESRYILQLRQYIPKEKITLSAWKYNLQSRIVSEISIDKTEEIKKLVESFSSENTDRKNLSASSLNTYRECQVKFFLQNILNINSDPERGDYMDPITIGNILHSVMMDLYLPEELQGKLLKSPVVIDSQMLEKLLINKDIIHNVTLKNIRKLYYRKEEGEYEIESGVIRIIGEEIEELARSIVEYDLSLTPFNLYGCEISKNLRIELTGGRIVNFRFAIDRLDEINIDGVSKLRIIDYKTGTRKRSADSIEDMFEGGYKSEQLFQLFVYAWLLEKVTAVDDVVTEIYYVPDLVKGEGGLPLIAKEKVSSFKVYKEEFSERLEKLIDSIFTSKKFCEPRDSVLCGKCTFKFFCSK